MRTTMQVKNGYIVAASSSSSTTSLEVPLLGSTSKALTAFGYSVPVLIDSIRSNGLPAPDYETEIVFEATGDEKKEEKKKKKKTGRGGGEAVKKDGDAAAAAATTSDDDNDPPIIPEQDLPYQSLKRMQQSMNLLTVALEDISRWNHRDYSQPKKSKEEHDRDRNAIINKRDKSRRTALEGQRARLQKKLSGESLSPDEVQAALEQEEERKLNMVRAINSTAMLAAVLLPMLLHERRNDATLKIGKVKLNAAKAQCLLLGEFVFDVINKHSCERLLNSIKGLLGLLIKTNLQNGDNSSTAWTATWRHGMDKAMEQAVAVVADQHPSPPNHDEFLRKFQSAAVQDFAHRLDQKFDLVSTKDQDEHTKYLASIDALQKRMDALCKKTFGPSSYVTVYGSCLSDLSLGKNADVDISLHVDDADVLRKQYEAGELAVEQYEKQMKAIIMTMFRSLARNRNEFERMEPAARARVPVIRGTWKPANNPHSADGSIHFDVCLLNDIAVANSMLVKEYSLIDVRVRQLMVLIKQWAKDNGVCSAKDNTLSSYAWVNLVVFYLQSLGLVPNLQNAELMAKAGVMRDADNKWHSVRNLDTCFATWEQVKAIWTPPENLKTLSVSALLYGFLSFYSYDFLTSLYMVGIKRGGGPLVPRTKFQRGGFFLCVEDPFETYDAHIPHDLATPVGENQQPIIMNRLQAGANHLEAVFQSATADGDSNATVTSLWPRPSKVATVKTASRPAGRGSRQRNNKAPSKSPADGNGDKRDVQSPSVKTGTVDETLADDQKVGLNDNNRKSVGKKPQVESLLMNADDANDATSPSSMQPTEALVNKGNQNNQRRKGKAKDADGDTDVLAATQAGDGGTNTNNKNCLGTEQIPAEDRLSETPVRGGPGRGRAGGRGGRGRGRSYSRGGRGRGSADDGGRGGPRSQVAGRGGDGSGRSGGAADGGGRDGPRSQVAGRGGDGSGRSVGGADGGGRDGPRSQVTGRGRSAGGRSRGRGRGMSGKKQASEQRLIPALPPGATQKWNVINVLTELQKGDTPKRNILVRVDFNVPMNAQGEIVDDSRIRGALPTIQVILRHKCNAILISHMGRPKLVQKGEEKEEMRKEKQTLSLKPIAEHLGKLLDHSVLFADDCLHAQETIEKLDKEGGSVALLENLRFYKEEEKNDKDFAQTLANYADAYVNDAFGTCHRAHASTAGVPTLLSPKLCGIGCLVAKELSNLDFSHASESEKIAAIIGGSKVSTKLPVIQGILKSADVLLLQGGLAFTFLKAQGISIGSSLLEDTMIDTAKDLFDHAKENGKVIVLPIDAVCAHSFPDGPVDKADTQTFDLTPEAGIPEGWMGLDIGPKSVKLFAEKLKGSTKIVLNGPAGVFESTPFDEGTRSLVRVLAELTKNGTSTVVGGGESVAALEQFGETDSVSYVSTGGGATLELLAGDVLPGIAAIADYRKGRPYRK
ncbi:hypothetical protein MPSEU_001088700 [Mayamaea pseudoterrestris]|nr:hypothetical protein MPSEU_001088700 [Mayamaea pseudoterrestris]